MNKIELNKTIVGQCNLCEYPIHKSEKVIKKGALHEWVRRRKPKPEFCECCKNKPPYDLANISGEYKRDVKDFDWLCRSCHAIRDWRTRKNEKKES